MTKIKLPEVIASGDIGRHACISGCAFFIRTWGPEVRPTKAVVEWLIRECDDPAAISYLWWFIDEMGFLGRATPALRRSTWLLRARFGSTYTKASAILRSHDCCDLHDLRLAEALRQYCCWIHAYDLAALIDEHFDLPD